MQLISALVSLGLLGSAAASPLLFGGGGTQTPPPFPPPDQDAFYVAPANLSKYAPGAVVRSRPVTTVVNSGDLAQAYQVYYRSSGNFANKQVAGSVATIFVPKKPANKTSIFSYQFYEDSVSFNCAPSWSLVANANAPNAATAVLDTPIFVSFALSNGWYAVAADHEGKNSSFISGTTEGVNILDAVRATINHEKLDKKAQVGFYGYSGGGHATAWAANLAGAYAPELNVIGAAHGGTPISPLGTYNFLNGGLFAGFAGAGVVGLANEWPELNNFINKYIDADGAAQLAKARGRDFCLPGVVTGFPFVNFTSYLSKYPGNPFDDPIAQKYLKIETLDYSVNPTGVFVPKFPTLQLHALLDEIVPYDAHAQFVDSQCKRGANIQFQTLPLAEHVLGEVESIPGALLWLSQAFSGTLAPFICGTPIPDFATIFSPKASEILTPDQLSYLRGLDGKSTPFGVINFGKTA